MTISGKSILITGATDGIGLESAIVLARQGARLHLVGRNPDKLETAARCVAAAGQGVPPAVYVADLASQASIRALATTLERDVPVLDVLLNNAGAIFPQRTMSDDGLEMTFALNHLGYFLLTQLLLPSLLKSLSARVVNVASDAHAGVQIDFDNLQGDHSYSGWKAYGRSKLANIYFSYELARRLSGDRITVNCLHPGFVASNFAGDAKGVFGWALGAAKRVAAISVQEGAKTPVYLCAADEVAGVTGRYFSRCKAVPSSRISYDEAIGRRLWQVSERLTGLMP